MKVSTKGADLFVNTRGDGPACVVLCNLGTAVYERQMPHALDQRLRMVFVDLRGSGQSTGEPADLTFDVLADDLEAVRAALGVARVAVLGHSILSMLAIEHARRRPDHVSCVVTVGAPPFGDMARLMAASSAFFERAASDERKRLLRENLARLPAGTPPAQAVLAQTPMRFFDPRYDAAPLFAGALVNPQLLMHLLGTLGAGWSVDAGAAPALRAPWLLTHGRFDYVSPYVLWDDVLPRLPGARLELFDRSGHQPFVEEPERFAAVVGDWVAINAARARE